MKVLLIAPQMSRTSTGEAFVAFKWAEALSQCVELTVMALQDPNHEALSRQLPEARVITWPQPSFFFGYHARFQAMFKPEWFFFTRQVRAFLKEEGGNFDIAHQIMPQAMRYPTPFRHFDLPYVIGPLGGSLPTPSGFRADVSEAAWFTRLRALDNLRLRHDPSLRRSYSRAAKIFGVAPYVAERLASIPLQGYENVLELGIDALPEPVARTPGPGLKLLHVGRGVRTKGLRDVIRAMALLKDLPEITLTSAGEGPEIAPCREEARQLGLEDRIRFMGLIPRAEVETLYRESDVFAFPSFREPAGNVLYEAMRWGLPVIAAAYGGPDWIVDEATGIKVTPETPEQMARDIATAIRKLATDPELRQRLGAGGRRKVAEEGLWPTKAAAMVESYRRILEDRR